MCTGGVMDRTMRLTRPAGKGSTGRFVASKSFGKAAMFMHLSYASDRESDVIENRSAKESLA